jgi:hypothetical protein
MKVIYILYFFYTVLNVTFQGIVHSTTIFLEFQSTWLYFLYIFLHMKNLIDTYKSYVEHISTYQRQLDGFKYHIT